MYYIISYDGNCSLFAPSAVCSSSTMHNYLFIDKGLKSIVIADVSWHQGRDLSETTSSFCTLCYCNDPFHRTLVYTHCKRFFRYSENSIAKKGGEAQSGGGVGGIWAERSGASHCFAVNEPTLFPNSFMKLMGSNNFGFAGMSFDVSVIRLDFG